MWNESTRRKRRGVGSENNGFVHEPRQVVLNTRGLKKRSWLLYVRVSLRGMKPRLRLMLPVALYVPHQWLLACDGLLALIPGQAGLKARRATDAIHAMLLQLMYAKPQTIADVDIRDGKQQVRVAVRTCGWSGGEEV